MTPPIRSLVIGTRGSALALWQARHVRGLLQAAYPHIAVDIRVISTRGDQILDTPLPLVGGKGVFTVELEAALHAGTIDCAVHSLKDLPTDAPDGLTIAAIPERASPADVLVSRLGLTLDALPQGARVGTSSTRRAAQLRYRRPDLSLCDIRGNVDTRLRKAHAHDSAYDAVVLARAGLDRLGRSDAITEELALEHMLPAPGQGALAVQTRDDPDMRALFAALNHDDTALAVTAERAFLAGLGGGCSIPVSALARWRDGALHLHGRVNAPDGRRQIDVYATARIAGPDAARDLGARLAQDARDQGASVLMEQHA